MTKDDHFIAGYLACAFWTEEVTEDDDGNKPLAEKGQADLAEEAYQRAAKDCREFLGKAQPLIERCPNFFWDQAGHDLWLTRNRHGTGFWDRPEWYGDQKDALTKLAHELGECWMYAGDDGRVYFA